MRSRVRGYALPEGKMANRVLVVDDEKLIVKGIRFSLEQDGMEVECAYDGEEALDRKSVV